MDRIVDHDFFKMVEDIKQMIKSAQYRALQTVNTEQISLYYTLTESLPKELSQFFPTSQELVARVETLTKHLTERKAKHAIRIGKILKD